MYPNQTHRKRKTLLIASLLCAFAWSSAVFSAPGKRADAEALTKSLAGLNHAYLKAAPGAKSQALQQLVDKASERQALLAELMETDPASVLRTAIPAHIRARMPEQVQALIEQRVDIEGELEVLYEDYPDGTHRLRHSVKAHDKLISLHFKSTPADLLTDTPAMVSGVLVGDAMAVESGEEDILFLALDGAADGVTSSGAPAPVPNTFGEQRVLVMLVNFQDNPVEPYTPQFAHDVIVGETSDFFLENSFGQTWLTGDVTNWFTIAVDSTVCDTINTRAYAEEAAINAGYDLGSYNRLVYAFPQNACAFWGSASVGGNPSRASLNGDLELQVTGHELGHNLGLYHGHSLVCNDGSVLGTGGMSVGTEPWPNCINLEYGDGVDIMGSSIEGHFSAYQKERLGWLGYGNSPDILVVESSGSYELSPFAAPGENKPKALKVFKADDSYGFKTWYYLEYRQPIGYDNIFNSYYSTMNPDNVYNGVTVHAGYEGNGGNSLFLLDMTTETTTDLYTKDPALPAGRTFLDPDGITTITTDWTNTNGAMVNISLAPPSCVANNPAIKMSPPESQWLQAGSSVTYTVTLTNRDSLACMASTFNMQSVIPTGWVANFARSSVTLDPGNEGTTTLEVTSSNSAVDGFYPLTVNVESASNPVYAASTQVTYVVSNPAINQAPVAVGDSASTAQDTEVLIDVLANDSDPDGDLLLLSSVTQGANGVVSINPNGSLIYMPGAGFAGTSNFSYSISDGNNGSDSATVIVDVIAAPSNHAPLALDDAVTLQNTGPVTIDVLANDSDPDGDKLSITSATAASKGSVMINADETITYTPGKRFKNGDNFTYVISDGSANATATVSISLQKSPGGKGGGKPRR